jgi:hypothetical protein
VARQVRCPKGRPHSSAAITRSSRRRPGAQVRARVRGAAAERRGEAGAAGVLLAAAQQGGAHGHSTRHGGPGRWALSSAGSPHGRLVTAAFRALLPDALLLLLLPLQARQLESLVRLAEARARCALREEVTRADAEDAVEILEGALQARWGCVGGNMGG